MGKRQERILNHELVSHFARITGKEANVLFKNGDVVHGVISEANAEYLSVRDLRSYKHIIPLPEIREVTLEFVAEH